jgi:teichuronic acid biosynthesis glycosyltransferase TuaC
MRVLLFSNHFPDGSQHGPLADLVGARAAALAELGIDVRVVAYGSRTIRAALRSLRKLRSEFDFDLIEAHGVLPAGVAAVRLAHELGVPCVVCALGPELEHPLRRSALRPRVAAALAGAQEVLAPSAASSESLFRLGCDRHKIHVVPDGIDQRTFRFVEPQEARRALGLSSDGALLIATCDDDDRAEHLLLAETVGRLRSAGVRAPLHVLGAGRGCNRLVSRITKLGLGETVVLHGDMDPEQLALWYQSATLQIGVCRGEVWPHPLHQAQACGLPLVTTAADGVEELVRETTGIIVEEGSSSDLSDAIREALGRTWDRRAIANHAPKHRWPDVTVQRLRILRAAALARERLLAETLQIQPA